jgi:hypothetical protein
VGLVLGVSAAVVFNQRGGTEDELGAEMGPEMGIEAAGFWSQVGLLRQASADLEDGEYDFFPNRRSIWVVNRTNGRMANYQFRSDELQSIDRSRVAQIDLKAFPSGDTRIFLSDRNLNNVLWVCNARTGDVQMWHPTRDGILESMGPIPTSTDLMLREGASR